MGIECTKYTLQLLNVFYMVIACILIAVASYAKGTSIIENVSVIGGLIVTGVFLLLVSILGIVGACRRAQVLLFFYMIILFLIFILQFCLAIACLAVNENQRRTLLREAWNRSSDDILCLAQKEFNCWGFASSDGDSGIGRAQPLSTTCSKTIGLPKCCMSGSATTISAGKRAIEKGGEAADDELAAASPSLISGASKLDEKCRACYPCYDSLMMQIADGLRLVGLLGLFFSFTELFGVWLTRQVRNHRSMIPAANGAPTGTQYFS